MTTRATQLNTSVLARLAERWRPVGLYLACLDKDGNLVWHDSQMPRVLALCLTADAGLVPQVRKLGEGKNFVATRVQGQLPWVHVQLMPIARRRKLSGWVLMLGRTEAVSPACEDMARLAQRASLDAGALLAQAQRVPLVPPATFTSLVKVAEQMHEDLYAAATANTELANVTEQLTSVYEEISLLYKISSGMRFSQKSQTFLETVCREVQGIGNYRAVVVSLVAKTEDGRPARMTGKPVVVGSCPIGSSELLHALREPIGEALSGGETQVYNEISADTEWSHLRAFTKRFVCVPLERDRRPLGVMVAIDKHDGTEFNSVDLKLLNNVGNQCSIFLENATLYQDMQDLFMGVLHALTQSIDAKDAYTRGHSQRVAELSRALARKIGLSDEECERIYLSGLLHDVGKIGVPEAVLTKPGRLTDAEFDAIKKHPAIGAQILGNIKQLQDILPGVLHHHERWDGRGYPKQLAGEAIPLIGRIICVADSFDAMSSTRTYRPALPLETVLAEIKRCAGTQFDPALANVFVTLDFEPYKKSVAEQTAASLGVAPLLESPAGGKA
jgi:HD-GYP domain-containing protein (c-di-GMP phosphodiesterase class II)